MREGVGTGYISFVQSTSRAVIAHLYQFTSISGANDYFTDLDVDITYNSLLWKSSGIRIDGLRRKTSVGLEVDSQDIKIYALPTDTLFGANFLTGAEEGLLDGCLITRFRAVFAVVTGNLLSDVTSNAPIQVWTMSIGYASEISKGGQTHVEMKVKSPLTKLQVNMPRNYYQPGCLWNLFDVGVPPGYPSTNGCTLVAADYVVTGTVLNYPSNTIIPITGGVINPQGNDGLPTYAQGRLVFTSGANNGLTVLIDTNDSSYLYLAYPLNTIPLGGDGIQFYPGCSKSYATCQLKYGNQNNFRGFDKVPPMQVSI